MPLLPKRVWDQYGTVATDPVLKNNIIVRPTGLPGLINFPAQELWEFGHAYSYHVLDFPYQ